MEYIYFKEKNNISHNIRVQTLKFNYDNFFDRLQEVGKTLSFGSVVAQEWNRVLMSSLPEHGNYSLVSNGLITICYFFV